MKAALLLPVFASRDAIGADVLGMFNCLNAHGVETRIFCEGRDDVDTKTYPVSELLRFAGGPDDLVIYHYSIGWPQAIEILRRARGFRVVRYHNITPADFFEGIRRSTSPPAAAAAPKSQPLATLGCELYLAISPFNGEDFLAAGTPAERVAVLPPFNRIEDLLHAMRISRCSTSSATARAPGSASVGSRRTRRTSISSMRSPPTSTASSDDARLVLIVKTDVHLARTRWRSASASRSTRLGDCVHFLIVASEGEAEGRVSRRHALVRLSGHEGFCVPLVEAMAFSRRSSARVRGRAGDDRRCRHALARGRSLLYAASAARAHARCRAATRSARSAARERYRTALRAGAARTRGFSR